MQKLTLSILIGAGIRLAWDSNIMLLGGNKKLRWSPYIGLDFASGEYYFDGRTTKKLFYVPIGLNYIGKGGFNFAGDIGVMNTDLSHNSFFMFSLKFGHRF